MTKTLFTCISVWMLLSVNADALCQTTTLDVHYDRGAQGTHLFQMPVDDVNNVSAQQSFFTVSMLEGSAEAYYYDDLDSVVFTLNAADALPGQGVTDVDGNYYETFIISNGDEWMAENLRTTRYSNGDTIVNAITDSEWNFGVQDTGKWCHHENDSTLEQTYGKLYNWYAADDDRNVCPTGWHIPNKYEMQELTQRYGGVGRAAERLKEPGYWPAGQSALNVSTFNGRAGGIRDYNGNFWYMNTEGYWWTSNQDNYYFAPAFKINYDSTSLPSLRKKRGHSIRCLKD